MDGPAPLASRRILIVDDQPSIRGVLEVALTDAGADVWTADDGDAALRAVEHAVPDLILLDLVMPGMSGWEVLTTLMASPRTASVPVILETSTEDFASFDRARKQGVAAFISKPFRLNEVIETCRRILEGARPLQGTRARDEGRASVQVRDTQGELIAVGHLLDVGPAGAQMELESPLSLGLSVSLTFTEAGRTTTQLAEVRWVTRVGELYHHGLAIRPRGGP